MCIRWGVGIHQWNQHFKDIFKMLYVRFFIQLLFSSPLTQILVDIYLEYYLWTSFVFHQIRHTSVPNRAMNMPMFTFIYATIGILFAFYLIMTFINIFACQPLEKFWSMVFVKGHYYNLNLLWQVMAVFNVASDAVILVLLISSIWKLKLPPKQKVGIWIVFGTGVL